MKITSSLPKGSANGLVSVAGALVTEPSQIHVVVALVDCKKTSTDNDTGDVEATARIRAIEVIEDVDDAPRVQRMLRRALEARLGRTVLPFELEQDIKAAFGNVDPSTGEIL